MPSTAPFSKWNGFRASITRAHKSPRPILEWVLVWAGLTAFLSKAWSSFCVFPLHAWNDVRLRPSFLLAEGLPLYPGMEAGPITTWMYGPAHPLWFYPTTWLEGIGNIYLGAAAWNIAGYALSFAGVYLFWPSEEPTSTRARWLALAAGLAVLPSAYLTYLQADNVALICGLLSLTFLARHVRNWSTGALWAAALLAATASFAKAHGVAVIAGELLGLALFTTLAGAWALLWRFVFCAAAWSLITLAVSAGPVAAWEHLVILPGNLPWVGSWAERTVDLSPELLLMCLLPAVLTGIWWRRKWMGPSECIATLVWYCSLPIGLAAAYKIGGSSNSLHGAFYLLPVLLAPKNRGPFSRGLLLITLASLTVFNLGRTVVHPIDHPIMARAQEADYLARGLGEAAWLPWRPLAVYLATGRQDHDEDGLYVRQVTGLYPSRRHVAEYLPPAWSLTAIEYPGMYWGIAAAMQPRDANRETTGAWLIFSVAGDASRSQDLQSTGHE